MIILSLFAAYSTRGNILTLAIAGVVQVYLRTSRCNLLALFWLLSVLPVVFAAKDDEVSTTSRCPTYDGVAANFVAWLIAFTAWVAWKAPDLIPILNEKSTAPPDPVDPDSPNRHQEKENP